MVIALPSEEIGTCAVEVVEVYGLLSLGIAQAREAVASTVQLPAHSMMQVLVLLQVRSVVVAAQIISVAGRVEVAAAVDAVDEEEVV